MALDIFKTHYMLNAVKNLVPPKTFLRDRYFPTNDAMDIFATEDVLVEYKKGSRKVAPFVAPRQKGITILRDGSYIERYTPPLTAPRRVLTIDDLERRGFGEALMSDMTPEQRQSILLMQDLDELSQMITRREEIMAAEILTTNKCVMKHYADDLSTVVEEKVIMFYDETGTNPASYVPGVKWDAAGAKIIDDIHAMIGMLSKNGLPATDLIVSPDVAAAILNNGYVQDQLNLLNYNIGRVEPEELTNGVSRICVLNVYGRMISIYAYDETYEDESGADKLMIPSGKVVLTAPAAGRTMYGAVTQLEQSDGQFYTYSGRRVPKYLSDAVSDVRTVTLSARPLLIPNNVNPWIVASVLTEGNA